jgi:High-affinity nickel-transport protein
MVALGIGIGFSAIASAPIGAALVSREKLLPFVTVICLGLFLGMRHSTDPDHVVAVSTIVSRQRSMRSSASIGLLWGLGHTITIFLVGAAIIIFGVVIPPRVGLSMEFCVALMLILLGILNLTGVTKWITERSTPQAGSGKVTDQSFESSSAGSIPGSPRPLHLRRNWFFPKKTVGRLGLYQTVRPLAIGLVHGLAGSAAVALLVLSTIKSPVWATAYLLVFGFGTMVGMMLMTTAISLPLVYAGNRFSKMNTHLATISGLASMAFGMFLVYHIGLVDGLFTAAPHWIPQ